MSGRTALAIAAILVSTSFGEGARAGEDTSAVASAPEPKQTPSVEPTARPLRIEFDEAAPCNAERELEQRTRQLLEAAAETADVTVGARLRQVAPDRYQLEMTLTGRVSGERSLQANTCGEVIEAGAIVLALAISKEALANAGGAPTPTPPDVEEAPPSPPEETPPLQRTAPAIDTQEPSSSLREEPAEPAGQLSVHLAAMLGTGWTPNASPGGLLGVGVEALGLRVDAAGYRQVSTTAPHEVAGTVAYSAWGGRARGCGRIVRSARFLFHLCGGVHLARVSAQAAELSRAATQRAWVYSLLLGGRVGFELWPRLSLFADGAYQHPTTRPRFVVTEASGDSIDVHRPRPGFVAALGVELGF